MVRGRAPSPRPTTACTRRAGCSRSCSEYARDGSAYAPPQCGGGPSEHRLSERSESAPKRRRNVMTTKSQRQHHVARLLTEHEVTSQPQLVELLAAAGIAATQATVSRDLEDL